MLRGNHQYRRRRREARWPSSGPTAPAAGQKYGFSHVKLALPGGDITPFLNDESSPTCFNRRPWLRGGRRGGQGFPISKSAITRTQPCSRQAEICGRILAGRHGGGDSRDGALTWTIPWQPTADEPAESDHGPEGFFAEARCESVIETDTHAANAGDLSRSAGNAIQALKDLGDIPRAEAAEEDCYGSGNCGAAETCSPYLRLLRSNVLLGPPAVRRIAPHGPSAIQLPASGRTSRAPISPFPQVPLSPCCTISDGPPPEEATTGVPQDRFDQRNPKPRSTGSNQHAMLRPTLDSSGGAEASVANILLSHPRGLPSILGPRSFHVRKAQFPAASSVFGPFSGEMRADQPAALRRGSNSKTPVRASVENIRRLRLAGVRDCLGAQSKTRNARECCR
jgi:hypothetical protein